MVFEVEAALLVHHHRSVRSRLACNLKSCGKGAYDDLTSYKGHSRVGFMMKNTHMPSDEAALIDFAEDVLMAVSVIQLPDSKAITATGNVSVHESFSNVRAA